METYASLMKGGDDGPAIIPGKASEERAGDVDRADEEALHAATEEGAEAAGHGYRAGAGVDRRGGEGRTGRLGRVDQARLTAAHRAQGAGPTPAGQCGGL